MVLQGLCRSGECPVQLRADLLYPVLGLLDSSIGLSKAFAIEHDASLIAAAVTVNAFGQAAALVRMDSTVPRVLRNGG